LEDRSVPSFGWASAVGADTGNAVATDAAGNVYMAGSFTNSFTPAGSSITLNSAGGSDIFVAKYTRSGTFLWATSMGGAQNDSAGGIAVDGSGNAFVVGSYAGAASFGSTVLTMPAGLSTDAYVAKLDTNSNPLWAKNGLNGAGVQSSAATVVAVDGSGNAYLGGSDNSTQPNAFVAKFDPSGARLWRDEFTTTGNLRIAPGGVAVSGGNVHYSGVFGGSVTFATASGNTTVTIKDTTGYVLKLTGNNQFVWETSFTQTKHSSGLMTLPIHIAADSAGNVYASGNFLGKFSFGSFVLDAGITFTGNGAVFVAKLAPTGSVTWAEMVGDDTTGSSAAFAKAIAVDGAGAVYLTGYFGGTWSFNPAGGGSLTSAGGIDAFALKLDTNGVYQWALQAGGVGDDLGLGIAVDSFGDVDLTGYIGAGTATFGDPTHTLTTATQTAFLWQIVQP
jgi:hypothetical protein